MNLFNKLFIKKEATINSYADFWAWFQQHQNRFFNIVNDQKNIERDFFDIISPKLDQVHEGIYYLTGMFDTTTAELILSAEGVVKNIVFVEELVAAAPAIKGWRFIASKPALDIADVSINMPVK